MYERMTATAVAIVMVGCASTMPIQPARGQSNTEPESVTRAGAGAAGLWQLRSEHLIWGMPRQTDNRHNVRFPGETDPRPDISVLVREGFVIGHYDLYRVPAWVAVRWSREDHDSMIDGSYSRDFGPDPELPRYAQAGTSYDHATSRMERGHMARHADNEAWGEDNSDMGCLMSNIVPQHKDMNGEAWNDLEILHQGVVADASIGISTVWVISGPIFEDTNNDGVENLAGQVGNGVGVPHSTYKVIGWFDGNGEFNARGYVVRQEDRVRNNPAHYLTPIDEIETNTGLDFFPELPTARAAQIEAPHHTTLWGSATGTGPGTGGGDGGQVRISALLPNPSGDEAQNEAVTNCNHGTAAVLLTGWKLRDAAGRTWVLFGTLQAGDERTFTRDGQPMALNNNGDTVELLDATGNPVDTVRYTLTRDGEWLDAADLR